MREAALYLYGTSTDEYPSRLVEEDMFDRRDKLQAMLADGEDSLELHLGYVLDLPTTEDIKPENVLIVRNPVFDATGKLVNTSRDNFEQGDIEEYPVIVDHWVPNFRIKKQTEHGVEEHASGLGLPANRLINHKSVQQYGNEKDTAEREILEPCGAALESFGTSLQQLDRLEENWDGGKVIYKPKAGALSKGIEIFETVADLRTAIEQGDVPRSGIAQPFIDLTEPLPNLKPLVPEYAADLRRANSKADRVREIRLHFFVTTDEKGERQIHAHPMLRASEEGAEIMTNWEYIPLDPEEFKKHYPQTVENTLNVAGKLAEVAGAPDVYGVTDVAIGRHALRASMLEFVADLNCRGPRMPDVSRPGLDIVTPAQKEFVAMQKTMARAALQAV